MHKINIKDENILITGAAGFIGAALASRLLNENLKIIGIDNLNNYYDINLKKFRIEKLKNSKNFEFFKGDISEKKDIEKIFSEYNPGIVINLAAQAGVRYSIINPDAYIKSNLIGFYNILESCRNSKNLKHLIFASSSSIYGENSKIPFSTEDKTDNPVSLYAATKKSNELLAYSYSKLYKIPSTGLRFFTVYGPAGRPDMAYFSFTEKLLSGKNIQIFNNGNCERDFTYIDDIIEGLYRVIHGVPNSETPFKVYNIGGGRPVNLLEFIKILHSELIESKLLPKNHEIEKQMEFLPMQPGDVPITFADTKELENDFDFKPSITLSEGLKKFVEWYSDFYKS